MPAQPSTIEHCGHLLLEEGEEAPLLHLLKEGEEATPTPMVLVSALVLALVLGLPMVLVLGLESTA